jgi:hypothetical protein
VARAVGAYFMVDMAHYAGPIAAGVYPNPVPVADFVTTTTHKSLRGPRGGDVVQDPSEGFSDSGAGQRGRSFRRGSALDRRRLGVGRVNRLAWTSADQVAVLTFGRFNADFSAAEASDEARMLSVCSMTSKAKAMCAVSSRNTQADARTSQRLQLSLAVFWTLAVWVLMTELPVAVSAVALPLSVRLFSLP